MNTEAKNFPNNMYVALLNKKVVCAVIGLVSPLVPMRGSRAFTFLSISLKFNDKQTDCAMSGSAVDRKAMNVLQSLKHSAPCPSGKEC